MSIFSMEIKSQETELQYRVEFNTEKKTCKVTCLSATGACSISAKWIHYAMEPLKLKITKIGMEDITYKCPWYKRKKVIKRIQKC